MRRQLETNIGGVDQFTKLYLPLGGGTVDNKVVLHLPMNGANNGTAFPDTSIYNKSVTRTGAVTSTAKSVPGFGGSAGSFNGTTDTLEYADSADWAFGSVFVIHLWVNFSVINSGNVPISSAQDGGSTFFDIVYSTAGAEWLIRGSAMWRFHDTITTNTWYHLAVVQTAGQNTRFYRDGTQLSPYDGSQGTYACYQGLRVGRGYGSTSTGINGYVQDVVIIKGSDNGWTGSTIPVPTAPFPNYPPQTSLLADKSFFGQAITANGDAKISSNASRNNGSSLYLDGSGDYLSFPAAGSALANWTTQDFVVESWVYPLNLADGAPHVMLGGYTGASTNYNAFAYVGYTGKLELTFVAYGSAGVVANYYVVTNINSTDVVNRWNHFATVRTGNTQTFYVNGILQPATAATAWTGSVSVGGNVTIGVNGTSDLSYYVNGYLSDFRISVGTNRGWTTPTIQIDSPNMSVTTGKDIVEYTKLWIPGYGANGSTDIKDRSAYGRTVTNSGVSLTTVAVQGKINTASISITANNYLAIEGIPALNTQFVIGGWFYPTTAGGNVGQVCNRNINVASGFTLGVSNTTYFFRQQADDLTTGTGASQAWHYVVWVLNGTNRRIFADGVKVAEDSNGKTQSFTGTTYLGCNADPAYSFVGYIQDMFILSDASAYMGTTIPVPTRSFSLRGLPQRSYTSVQYDGVADGIDKFTKLYLPLSEPGNAFTDKSFYGRTVTNTSVTSSTTQSKFGGSSASWNGSSSLLAITDSADLTLGTNDFTLNFWVCFSSLNASNWNYLALHNDLISVWWQFTYHAGLGGLLLQCSAFSTSDRIFPWTPSTGIWYHIALVKSSNVYKMYVNGSALTGSFTDANALPNVNAPLRIGSDSINTNRTLNGYMQEFILVNGKALWTSDFTPPTRPAQIPQRIATRDMQSSVSTVANPVLYLKGDSYTDSNTVIYDSSQYARTITNTNVVTRTINQKFGPSSMYFNGSSSYLYFVDATELYFTNKSFVIAFWWCPTDVSVSHSFCYQVNTASFGNASIEAVRWNASTGKFQFYFTTDGSASTETLAIECTYSATVNVWHHVVFVRSGSNGHLFINGAKITNAAAGFGASSIYNSSANFYIGTGWNSSALYEPLKGYLDEFTMIIGSDLGYTGATIPVPQGPYKFT